MSSALLIGAKLQKTFYNFALFATFVPTNNLFQ